MAPFRLQRVHHNGFGHFFWGLWANAVNRYLGFKFVIAGQTHYGWARLSVATGSVAGMSC